MLILLIRKELSRIRITHQIASTPYSLLPRQSPHLPHLGQKFSLTLELAPFILRLREH